MSFRNFQPREKGIEEKWCWERRILRRIIIDQKVKMVKEGSKEET